MKKLLIQCAAFAMIFLSACSYSPPTQDISPTTSALTVMESNFQGVDETMNPGTEANESCSQPGNGFFDTENAQASTGSVKKEPVTTDIPPTINIEDETVEETGSRYLQGRGINWTSCFLSH